MSLDGTFQKTQLGRGGILSYYSPTSYFTFYGTSLTQPFALSGGSAHIIGSGQRITWNANGGNVSNSYRFSLSASENDYIYKISNESLGSSSRGILLKSGNSTTSYHINFQTAAGTNAGSIYSNGSTTTFATTSDERLKENIVDTSINGLDIINNLKVRDFNWKLDKRQDTGLIAQEALGVYPKIVLKPEDETIDNWGIGYAEITVPLIKAVQELTERIKSLEAEIKILKG